MRFTTAKAFILPFHGQEFDGARYFVPEFARHRPASQAILRNLYYEPLTHRLIAFLLEWTPGNLVHAGAFFGDMLPSFSRACGPSGTVYAFEPLLENYVLARLTVDANRLTNVALFNAALGARLGPCQILGIDPSGRHAGGSASVSAQGEASSAMMTIDALGLDQVTVIQLDVEGFELPALRGAQATIAARRPMILVEDQRANCAPFLTATGYQTLGMVPGLTVWAPVEKPQLAEAVSRHLTTS